MLNIWLSTKKMNSSGTWRIWMIIAHRCASLWPLVALLEYQRLRISGLILSYCSDWRVMIRPSSSWRIATRASIGRRSASWSSWTKTSHTMSASTVCETRHLLFKWLRSWKRSLPTWWGSQRSGPSFCPSTTCLSICSLAIQHQSYCWHLHIRIRWLVWRRFTSSWCRTQTKSWIWWTSTSMVNQRQLKSRMLCRSALRRRWAWSCSKTWAEETVTYYTFSAACLEGSLCRSLKKCGKIGTQRTWIQASNDSKNCPC